MESIVIEIRYEESVTVFDNLKINYTNYSHNHVSHEPDEPFAATEGVYFFEITDGIAMNLLI